MLSPEERTLLVDLLAPPAPGYRLEHALATTFTLHLTALLPVPLGLAGADLSASTDQLSILQAIRNYADLIDIFCQAGHVAVPAQRNDLLAFLEPMVHQVKAPRPGHLFHPKLWVLRFVHDDGTQRFSLVCGSRNLTHDRAWDAVICLEGHRTLQPRKCNRPLTHLLASLPRRVAAGLSDTRAGRVAELAEAIRLVPHALEEREISGDDHYSDFIGTVDFLEYPRQAGTGERLKTALGELRRRAITGGDLQAAKDTVETLLRKVMCRTERPVSGLADMVTDKLDQPAPPTVQDMLGFVALTLIASATRRLSTAQNGG